MALELNVIFAYGIGLILLYIFGWILLVPIKWIIRLMLSSAVGGIMLLIVNSLGSIWNLGVAINPLSAIVVGVLGIPGIILLFLFKYLF